MGTLSDKLSYLQGTKAAIKEAIEARGVSVGSADTFRSYADKIGQIDTLHAQSKTVTPSTSQQTVQPDSGYNALSSVTVQAVTSAIDASIAPENIKQGVTILGVTGGLISDEQAISDYINIIERNNIDNYAIPTSVTRIGNGAFYMMSNLRSVVIPNTVTHIGTYAFSGTGLTHVTIPASVVTYGDWHAFSDCKSLESVTLQTTALNIRMFQGCSRLGAVAIPRGTTRIPGFCFYNCTALSSVSLPSTLTSVDSSAFMSCSALENVTLESGFNCGISLSASTRYSADTLVAMLQALADRTGQSAYTLTLGATNLSKLSNEQKAIATSKNWNLA